MPNTKKKTLAFNEPNPENLFLDEAKDLPENPHLKNVMHEVGTIKVCHTMEVQLSFICLCSLECVFGNPMFIRCFAACGALRNDKLYKLRIKMHVTFHFPRFNRTF